MNTYAEYKEVKARQDAIVDGLSAIVQMFPKGEMGLQENTPEFVAAYRAYLKAFKVLQQIHTEGSRKFKSEIYADHMAKRTKK